MKRSVCLLILALVSACGASVPNYDYSQEPDPRTSEYVLGVGDELRITVWNNPALSTDAIVRPDGTITMPLAGDLRAAGETPTSLKNKIQARLTEFIKLEGSPVTIAVTAANSYRFTVSGEVQRPGVISSPYYVTIAEAIALAGGFTRFAQKNSILIMRRDPRSGTVRNIPIAYDFIASGERPDMNIVILSGDSIHVP